MKLSRRFSSSLARGTGKGLIINPGLVRSGTASLSTALVQLGLGPTYHFCTNTDDMARHMQWFTDGNRMERLINDDDDGIDYADFVEAAGVRVLMDVVALGTWKPAFRRYPDAKVIICVRDFDDWYESTQFAVNASAYNDGFMEGLKGTPMESVNSLCRLYWPEKDMWNNPDRKQEIRQHCYEKRIEEVKSVVPTEQLLIFNVTQGWSPLCEFLEMPIPDTMFPFENRRQELANLIIEGTEDRNAQKAEAQAMKAL